jgi:hypothetical protein
MRFQTSLDMLLINFFPLFYSMVVEEVGETKENDG